MACDGIAGSEKLAAEVVKTGSRAGDVEDSVRRIASGSDSMRETIKLCCIVALTIFSSAVLLELNGLLRDVRRDERKIADDTENLIATAQRASDAAYTAETGQLATLQRTSSEIYKTTAAARLVLIRFDRSLNDKLVPGISAALQSTVDLERVSSSSLGEATAALRPSLENLSRASAAAADAMADPGIRDAIKHLDAAAASTDDSVRELDQSLTDVRQMADKARATYLKPVNLWWGLVKELLPLAGSAAQVVK